MEYSAMSDNGDIQEIENPDNGERTEEKVIVVGVRFRPCGKVYTFDASDIEAGPGSKVIVDSEMGLSLGHVVTPKYEVLQTGTRRKKVLRVATEEDFEKLEENRKFCEEARAYCIEKAAALNLQMKVVETETTLDRKKIIFYFTADGRIDFRELVRELAARFRTRIEMRQIGVRDEVKLLGGIGACGRQTCCSLFLTSFAPITIKMAKQQSLSINQNKLSGICGRLMCCLSYEYREYMEEKPAAGAEGEMIISGEAAEEFQEVVAEEPPAEIPGPGDAGTEPEEPAGPGTPAEERKEEAAAPAPVVESKKRRRRRRRGRKSGEPAKEAAAGKDAVRAEESSESGTAKEDNGGRKKRHFGKRKKFRRKKKK
jgi:cell fate regulator YaaT (PSP1 superfamily)